MRIVAESESESSESEKSKRTLGVCLSVSLYLVCYLEKKTPIYCGPISSFFVGLFQLIKFLQDILRRTFLGDSSDSSSQSEVRSLLPRRVRFPLSSLTDLLLPLVDT
jgi:hypothetical protein